MPILLSGGASGLAPVFSPNGLTARLRSAVSRPTHSGVRPRGALGRANGGQCKTIGCQHVAVGELSAGKNAFGIGKGLCCGRHTGKSFATNDSIGWFGTLRGETPPGLVEDFRKAGYTVTAVN